MFDAGATAESWVREAAVTCHFVAFGIGVATRWRFGLPSQPWSCLSIPAAAVGAQETLDSGTQKHRENITAEYSAFGWVENENGKGWIDTVGTDQRRRMIEGSVEKYRKEQNASTAEERAKLLATLRAAQAALDLIRGAWASPIGDLMRSALGSEKRAI